MVRHAEYVAYREMCKMEDYTKKFASIDVNFISLIYNTSHLLVMEIASHFLLMSMEANWFV